MDHHDRLKMKYIVLAAVIGAALFLVLAFGNLGREWSSAKSGNTAAAADASQAGTVGSGSGEAAESETAESETAESTVETSGVTADITVTATGDVTLGRDENFDYDRSMNAYYDEYGAAYFFENVSGILSSDDLTIINFEGTLTTSEDRADKEYAFKADPSWVEVLTDGSVEAANIANNHSEDYGTSSLEDTEAALEGAGIEYFGYDHSIVMDVNGIRVGLTGTMELFMDVDECREAILSQIENVQNEGADLIICSVHWGDERAYQPTDEQVTLAHAAIDAGADLVIGHHPHRLQLVDTYNGKYIFYSLGNFCFGGNSSPSDMDSALIQMTFHFENGELTGTDEPEITPISISSAEGYNNYQPTPFEADSDGYERVMTKLRGEWE